MKRKVTIGIILFVTGIILLYCSFLNHVTDYVKTHESRSLHNAQTIDDNIEDIIDECRESLEFLENHNVFARIHKRWLEEGDEQGLKDYLKDHLISRNKNIVNAVVIQNEEVIFSIDEKKTYTFTAVKGIDDVCFCKGDDNKYYLAVLNEMQENIFYASMLDLERFYNEVANEKNQMRDGAVFISADGGFVIYSQHGRLSIGPREEVRKDAKDTECVEVLLDAHENQKDGILFYQHYNPAEKQEKKDFVLCLLVNDTGNKIFTIGVMMSFGETMNSIQTATSWALWSGIIIAIGSVILVNAVIGGIKDSKKRKQELQTLYEKNIEMEKKNLELQEQAHRQRLETIGILTSGVAHEFNNLLTPIMGYSMMTLEQISEEDEDIYENVLEIYNASRQAKDIIYRLSELSRKKDTVTFENLAIDDIVNKVLNVARSAQPKKVIVNKALNCEGITISCNETLMMQMILNLILNAFQVMDEEGGAVDISTRTEGNQLILSVGDNGPGVPEELLGKIFEPFFTTKQATKGTGLGLSIVSQVAEAHHGKINVKNKENGGCLFEIYLPISTENITQ